MQVATDLQQWQLEANQHRFYNRTVNSPKKNTTTTKQGSLHHQQFSLLTSLNLIFDL